MSLKEKIYNAGIVGAGGAGFPSHIKLPEKVEYLIANAAECEPLLKTDQFLMLKEAKKIIKALCIIGSEVSAKHIIIGTKKKYVKQIEALSNAIKEENAPIEIKTFKSFYPLGDEQTLVYNITKRAIKAGGIPLDVGCVVFNVATLCNIYDSLSDIPVTSKYISILGEVDNPSIINVPVGANIRDILYKCGVMDNNKYIIVGGPMMGRYYPIKETNNLFVKKTTGALIVIDDKHYLVSKRNINYNKIKALAKSSCIQCSFCSDLCPRNLLGHKINPHLVMRSVGFANMDNIVDNSEHILDKLKESYFCCECGICEYYSCPMGINPANMNIYMKSLLRKENIKPDKDSKNTGINKFIEYRRVSTDRLISKLELDKYSHTNFNIDNPIKIDINKVTIMLSQHIGMPAEPIVKERDFVEVGQMIGKVPFDKVGANIHASINGIVENIDSEKIVINGEKI